MKTKLKLTNTKKLLAKAQRLIPGSSQTFSKGPDQFVMGVAPAFLERGRGSHVWDVDGNEFIDYAMALGPIILGHGDSAVTRAVREAADKSAAFTLPHRLEVELAELLCKLIPCAEMVRFGKNGSDVTSGAVRAARAFTGREKIACSGYHGWQDWYIATTTRDAGIPAAVKKLTMTFKYNDIGSLKKLFEENPGEIACVIMEPVGVVEPAKGFLESVKAVTHENGAVLIFDEVVTGFRLAMGGAQEYYKVVPDLGCFGKAMANGYPVSAVVGKREIMKYFSEIFFSFTFGGEIVSIAAAIATVREMKRKKVIPHLWKMGRQIKEGLNTLASRAGLASRIQCIGLAPRTVVTFKDANGGDDLILKSLFQQECLKRGILFTGGHNICFSHSQKDIDRTLKVYGEAMRIVKDAVVKNDVRERLEGEPVKAVFRKA